MRVLAVIGVVAIHASSGILTPTVVGQHGLTYYQATVAGSVSRASVPLFLAIAGWALLTRRPAESEERWLGRRAVRLVLPLLSWSLIYVVWALVRANLIGLRLWADDSSLIDWLGTEARLLYTGAGVRSHLWFMYALIQATLAVWLIQTVGRVRNRSVYVGASAVLILLWGIPPIVSFTSTWATMGWVLGYFGLGWLLLERQEPSRQIERLAGLGLFVGLSMVVVWANLSGVTWVQSGPSPVIVAATTGLLLGLRGISFPESWSTRVNTLGGLTFGVFLVHELALDLVSLAWRAGGPLAFLTTGQRSAVWVPAAAVISFALVWLWHKWHPLEVALG